MSQDKITFKCTKCGSTLFQIPSNPKPGDVVTCDGCGATGRYADIQAAALKEAKRVVEKEIKDALKKAGFK